MDDDKLAEKLKIELDNIRADGIDHLMCSHCSGIDDVRPVDFIEYIRHLCVHCRRSILEMI